MLRENRENAYRRLAQTQEKTMSTELQWQMDSTVGPVSSWQKLLVPIDFSAASDAALRVAVSVARSCGARLTLLHVVDINGHAPDVGSVKNGQLMAAKRSDGAAKLRVCSDSLVAGGLTVVPIVLEGLPSEQILCCAKAHDVVVLARPKRRARWRWFSKRTWSAVAANCPASVILIPV